VEKVNGTHDADRPIYFEPQQIEVSGDDEICLAGKSTGKNVVIVRVFLDNVGNGLRDNDFPCFVYESHVEADVLLVPMKVSPRNPSKFSHNGRRDDELIVAMNGMGPYLKDWSFRSNFSISRGNFIETKPQHIEK